MERHIATYKAQGANGMIYTVFEFQSFIDASSQDGPATIAGMKRLELEDGRHVNFIDATTFKIVATGELIRRTN